MAGTLSRRYEIRRDCEEEEEVLEVKIKSDLE